jgi:hypothetical protein
MWEYNAETQEFICLTGGFNIPFKTDTLTEHYKRSYNIFNSINPETIPAEYTGRCCSFFIDTELPGHECTVIGMKELFKLLTGKEFR